ncbi:MAG: metallophosphoesterase [Ignavibacteriales bacterium]|nr:metallophosphoesterase [Ignavibacteriales bacterium]
MKHFKLNLLLAVFVVLSIAFLSSCIKPIQEGQKEERNFTFVFMTDIHVKPENNAIEGFKQAIKKVNELSPDFVITGGDLVYDVLEQNYGRADSLYNIYLECQKEFKMPVYNTIGNHEVFGLYPESGVDKNHPEFGKKMYEKRIGKRFYSFEHKGWKIYILDSIGESEEGTYYGYVDSVQMTWIKNELQNVDTTTPIIISVHIPFITTQTQILEGALAKNSEGLVITNSKEVLDLFAHHNLKLVLQGHLHFLEDIYVQDKVHFITAGAVCSKWWKGKYYGLEEGFLLVRIEDGNISWEYIDYGWEVDN